MLRGLIVPILGNRHSPESARAAIPSLPLLYSSSLPLYFPILSCLGGAVAAQRAHNPKVEGSNPSPDPITIVGGSWRLSSEVAHGNG